MEALPSGHIFQGGQSDQDALSFHLLHPGKFKPVGEQQLLHVTSLLLVPGSPCEDVLKPDYRVGPVD